LNLLRQDPSASSDLRRGIIFIALSLPIIFSLVIGGNYQEAAIFGGMPLCVGLAYLLVRKLGKRELSVYTTESKNSEINI